MSSIAKQKGFVTTIILIIVAFILLKYFFDLEPKAAVDLFWSYIEKPAMFLWNNIIWPLLNTSYENFQHLINNGTPPGIPEIPQI
jgi:hypothetical protein